MTNPKSSFALGSGSHFGSQTEPARAPVVLAADGAEAAAAPSPDPLETACIALIDRLRQLRRTATESRERARYGRAAAVGQRMLLAVLDFAEARLPTEALGGIQERIADAYEQIRQIDLLVGKSKRSLVHRALGRRPAPTPELLEAYTGLGDSIAVVIITAIAGGADRFESGSDLAKQMADRLKLLVGELRTEW